MTELPVDLTTTLGPGQTVADNAALPPIRESSYQPPSWRSGEHPDAPMLGIVGHEALTHLFNSGSSHAHWLHQGRYRLVELQGQHEALKRRLKLRRLAAIDAGAIEDCKNEQQREAAIASWLAEDESYQDALHDERGVRAAIDTLTVDVELDEQMLRLYRVALYALGGDADDHR